MSIRSKFINALTVQQLYIAKVLFRRKIEE